MRQNSHSHLQPYRCDSGALSSQVLHDFLRHTACSQIWLYTSKQCLNARGRLRLRWEVQKKSFTPVQARFRTSPLWRRCKRHFCTFGAATPENLEHSPQTLRWSEGFLKGGVVSDGLILTGGLPKTTSCHMSHVRRSFQHTWLHCFHLFLNQICQKNSRTTLPRKREGSSQTEKKRTQSLFWSFKKTPHHKPHGHLNLTTLGQFVGFLTPLRAHWGCKLIHAQLVLSSYFVNPSF